MGGAMTWWFYLTSPLLPPSSPKEIEEEEYHSFYKSFTKDYQDPLGMSHFTAEGEVTFRAIIFVPKVSLVSRSYHQFGLWTKDRDGFEPI